MNISDYLPVELQVWVACLGFLVGAWKVLGPVNARVDEVARHLRNPMVATRWARRALYSGYALGALMVLVLATGVCAYRLLESKVDQPPAVNPVIRAVGSPTPVFELAAAGAGTATADIIILRIIPEAVQGGSAARYLVKEIGVAEAAARIVYALSLQRHVVPGLTRFYWTTVFNFVAVYTLGVGLLVVVARFAHEWSEPAIDSRNAESAADRRGKRRMPCPQATLTLLGETGNEVRRVVDVSTQGVRLQHGRRLEVGQSVSLSTCGSSCAAVNAVVLEDSEHGTRLKFEPQTVSSECVLALIAGERHP